MKRVTLFIAFAIISLMSFAQIENPISWSFKSKTGADNETKLLITATIKSGWHIYSQFTPKDGPVPTSFKFNKTNDYELIEKPIEKGTVKKEFQKEFGVEVWSFAEEVVFIQKIKLKSTQATISGSVEFMACNDERCLPPDEVPFKITVKGPTAEKADTVKKNSSNTAVVTATDTPTKNITVEQSIQKGVAASATNKNTDTPKSLWAIFIAGLLGGIAAFFMPCIFPMLPFTVSYFTKSSSKNRKKALAKALVYAASIIVIYVAVGLIVSIIFGADALNSLSTNGIFNLFFFLLLIVFGLSFLGAFEITLPSKWVNKSDEQSEKSGGLLGIFFMATTLALVSFSCTGPIIGTLLVQAATMGQYLGPAIGMFGFALALAIPFALFAMFPSWLNSMPKSGGWLNSVKVTLGFLELALALKFLSNVDLAYHWNWFDREVYLVLWITIFGLLGMYLLGKLKFPHDGEFKGVSTIRLSLAIIVISFTIYMIPGLWGAPLRSIAAFLPPQQTQDFDLYTSGLGNVKTNGSSERTAHKYGDLFHAPHNLDAFFDYDEGLAYAKKVNKPVMIDFTGHACVNCRKMESDVWSKTEVLNKLNNDFVLIQLFVDDKTPLPESEQFVSEYSGKTIKSLGNKWSDYQAKKYNNNSQPYYVLLDGDGNLLEKPQGADYDVARFAAFLDRGLAAFRKK